MAELERQSVLIREKARRKLAAAVGAAAQFAASFYHSDVTQNQVDPPGTRLGCIDGFRSCPGEFPYRDFGDGEESIGWGLDFETVTARSGTRESGRHLYYLTFAERFGQVESFRNHQGDIQDAARLAIEATS